MANTATPNRINDAMKKSFSVFSLMATMKYAITKANIMINR